MNDGLRWKTDHRPAATAKVHRAAVSALTDAAEFLLEESNRSVPIEESTLERSGHVTVDPRALKASVSYDTPYAVRQHEDTRLRHDAGRRAKWLERSLHEQATRLRDFLQARLKAALR